MRTITVQVRRTTQNRTGGRVDAGSYSLPGCAWWPGASSEELAQRDEVTATSTLSVPYTADIRATDEIVLPTDEVWQVNGVDEPYESPFTGWRPGRIVHLERVTG